MSSPVKIKEEIQALHSELIIKEELLDYSERDEGFDSVLNNVSESRTITFEHVELSEVKTELSAEDPGAQQDILRTTPKQQHACNVCNKSYTRRQRLKEHQRTHTGERPYACKTCGKAFKQRNSLTGHERIHTGERPYQCNICLKTFRYSNGVAVHKIGHIAEGYVGFPPYLR